MAIQRVTSGEVKTPPTELTLTINNGDFQALRGATERLGFINEESLLRFALAVFSKSATTSLTIIDLNGNKISLTPSEDLLRSNDSSEQ